jgi:hypothetical protein
MDTKTIALTRKMGSKNTKVFLETLARNKQFKSAIETPIGVELLTDVTNNLQNLIEIILNGEDTIEVRAEVKAFRKILNNWSQRINNADSDQLKFNTITKGV